MSVRDDIQPATIVAQLQADVDAFAAKLPPSYRLETGGAVEESGKGQGPIAAIVPVMLFAIATILMVQLQSFSRPVTRTSSSPTRCRSASSTPTTA